MVTVDYYNNPPDDERPEHPNEVELLDILERVSLPRTLNQKILDLLSNTFDELYYLDNRECQTCLKREVQEYNTYYEDINDLQGESK